MKNFFNRHDVAILAIVFFLLSVAFFIFSAAFNMFLFYAGWNNALIHHVPRPLGGFNKQEYLQIIWQAIPFFILFTGIVISVNEFFRHKKARAKMDKALKDYKDSFKTKILAFSFFFLCGTSSVFAQGPGSNIHEVFSKNPKCFKVTEQFPELEKKGYTIWRTPQVMPVTFFIKGGEVQWLDILFDFRMVGQSGAAEHYASEIQRLGRFKIQSDNTIGYNILYEDKPAFAEWIDELGFRTFLFSKQKD